MSASPLKKTTFDPLNGMRYDNASNEQFYIKLPVPTMALDGPRNRFLHVGTVVLDTE